MLTKLYEIKNKEKGYWGERIIAELEYACKLSKVKSGEYDTLIGNTINFLYEHIALDEVLTKGTAQKAETMLMDLSEASKKYTVICASHAHIDMNWMWGFAETVAITLDTFRTMLNLMKEYPQFKFSQSQASVCRIVEEYAPKMLEEIKQRVKEGRWEVTASTWVETDKNMPNGESLSRHILYTKRYLSKLLDIDPDSLNIDFEPDTFGHNLNVPEILTNGGVKYYYHCRGYEGKNIYKWQSPSGNSILVYREPIWYNAGIEPSMVTYIPEFCEKYGLKTTLKVYGVGDHGGGPSRRDIEKLIDMADWPIFPEIKFGSFSEFFKSLDSIYDKLTVETNELNFIFTGCYTTQTRIKTANRISEAKLNEAEAFCTLSTLFADGEYRSECFEESWRKVLFNHFHDILPGSGMIDTREFALGQFQQVLATANTEISIAFRNIAEHIDTSDLTVEEGISATISEGAGVGFGIKDYGIPQTERGRGKNRVLHFFNPSAYQRNEAVEITVWDWLGDKGRIKIKDAFGEKSKYQIIDNEVVWFWNTQYWDHKYMKLLIDVNVPPYGYSTYILSESEPEDIQDYSVPQPRLEKLMEYVLENEYLKVAFDGRSAAIISMVDKVSGMEISDTSRQSGIFRLIDEDDKQGMTAWIVGQYMDIQILNKKAKISKMSNGKSSLRQWIEYSLDFRVSKLKVKISLENRNTRLDFDVECDWHEKGQAGKGIPQLNFFMPLGYKCSKYVYDIPFGTIERQAAEMDVPANSWGFGIPEDEGRKGLALITNSRYGMRGTDDAIALTLIRSSYDPDPYPESGVIKTRFALQVVDRFPVKDIIEASYNYNHPLSYISGTVQTGTLPCEMSYLSVESGSVVVSAIKMPENYIDSDRLLIRMYETEGKDTKAVIKLNGNIGKTYFVDINEKFIESGNISTFGNKLFFEVKKNSLINVCIEITK